MTDDKRHALLNCLGELASAREQLDDCDDQDDELVVAIHWDITDIMNTIDKELQ
jgi:hypothetical protein